MNVRLDNSVGAAGLLEVIICEFHALKALLRLLHNSLEIPICAGFVHEVACSSEEVHIGCGVERGIILEVEESMVFVPRCFFHAHINHLALSGIEGVLDQLFDGLV